MRKTRSSRRTMRYLYLAPPGYGYPSFSHLGVIETRAWDAFEEETRQLYIAGGCDGDKPRRRRRRRVASLRADFSHVALHKINSRISPAHTQRECRHIPETRTRDVCTCLRRSAMSRFTFNALEAYRRDNAITT